MELQKFDLPAALPKIAVAVSGGSDSIALAVLLKDTYKNTEITAITIDHNLRAESSEEAKIVKKQMEDLGISHQTLLWEHKEITSNIQKQARSARMHLLTTYCKENGIENLFVAHNKNDVAETFLMNLFRGSGVYGLASIPNKTIHSGVNILRPLLSTHKKDIKDFLESINISWIEDPSNTNPNFLRTKVRSLMQSEEMKKIIDDEEALIDRIALNANNLARAREALEESTNHAIKTITTLHQEGYLTILLEEFLNMNEETALKLLASCLTTISGAQEYTPRMNSLKNLYKNITSKKIQTLWGCEVIAKDDLIYIYKELGKTKPSLEKISSTEMLWDGRLKIEAKTPQSIKSIEVLNSETLNKFPEAKLKKIPNRVWKTLPLITTYDTKVYVPFLNDGDTQEFSVKFLPLVSLEKTSFFHCN